MTRYSGPIPSSMNERARMPRRPYARLEEIIKRAEAGEKISDIAPELAERFGPVIERNGSRRRQLEPHAGPAPASFGALIVTILVDFGIDKDGELPTYDMTEAEIKAAHMAGRRHLDRRGLGDIRLSYRRRDECVVWFLTKRKQIKEQAA